MSSMYYLTFLEKMPMSSSQKSADFHLTDSSITSIAFRKLTGAIWSPIGINTNRNSPWRLMSSVFSLCLVYILICQ